RCSPSSPSASARSCCCGSSATRPRRRSPTGSGSPRCTCPGCSPRPSTGCARGWTPRPASAEPSTESGPGGWTMTGQPEHVVIVVAGLARFRTAQQLRAAALQGRISLVGAEPHPPYDRPPLSKQVLTGEWEPDRTFLAGPDTFDELGVRTHFGNPAVALRPGERDHELELADGAALHADAVVIATGLVARELPDQPAHVHTLRTLDDALALRATLESAKSLLVVG